MKSLRPTVILLALVTLSGCASISDHDDRASDVRATYKQMRAPVPSAYQTESERRTSYPGGTSAAEWKSLNSPEK